MELSISMIILAVVFVLGVVLIWTKRNEPIGAFLVGIVVGAILRGFVH